MNIKIADKLIDLRRKTGMSQEAVAEKLGVSRQALSRWERAEGAPDMNNLMQLSKLYQISLDDLLSNDIASKDMPNKAAETTKELISKDLNNEKPDTLVTQIPFPFIVPVFIFLSLFGFHEGYNWFGRHKPNTMQRFPFPIIIVTVYFLVGLVFSCWTPTWIIFFTVPMYYTVAALIKR